MGFTDIITFTLLVFSGLLGYETIESMQFIDGGGGIFSVLFALSFLTIGLMILFGEEAKL